jgi:hypothetical protein
VRLRADLDAVKMGKFLPVAGFVLRRSGNPSLYRQSHPGSFTSSSIVLKAWKVFGVEDRNATPCRGSGFSLRRHVRTPISAWVPHISYPDGTGTPFSQCEAHSSRPPTARVK